MVVFVVSRCFTLTNPKATYRYYRGSPESAALSCQSPASSPVPSGLEDVYTGNLDDHWEAKADDGGAVTSGY